MERHMHIERKGKGYSARRGQRFLSRRAARSLTAASESSTWVVLLGAEANSTRARGRSLARPSAERNPPVVCAESKSSDRPPRDTLSIRQPRFVCRMWSSPFGAQWDGRTLDAINLFATTPSSLLSAPPPFHSICIFLQLPQIRCSLAAFRPFRDRKAARPAQKTK